ncbi:MAG: ATP-dependent DNA ligase, partial [Ignavibacteriaceae bacterium]|nr:ATP-dependent DNA ligase [Ignavibacteriaceae bacterium]
MNNFACLFKELDETTDDNIKTEALVNYFNKVPPCDSLWAISLLLGRKIKRVVSVKRLKQWAVDLARTPQWLFDECFESVRDLAETAALILPYNNSSNNITLQILIEEYLLPL